MSYCYISIMPRIFLSFLDSEQRRNRTSIGNNLLTFVASDLTAISPSSVIGEKLITTYNHLMTTRVMKKYEESISSNHKFCLRLTTFLYC